MNLDPLADVPPPRYAIESDDEDEDEGILGRPQTPSSKSKCNVEVEIAFKSDKDGQELEKHVPLIVASGQAGSVLARLFGCPPICSRVYVNSIEIGYFVQIPLTSQRSKFTVLISESESSQGTLPLAYIYPYTQKVIDELEPSRVSILDTYSHPTYASGEPPRTVYDAPVRYLLGTSSEDTVDLTDRLKRIFDTGSGTILEKFSPPNLIHSTSAAFVNISALPPFSLNKRNDHEQRSAVLLLLLPSPHIGLLPSMRPRYLGEVPNNEEEAVHSRIGIPHTDSFGDGFPWSSEVLLRVVKGLFASAGRSVGGDVDRELEGLLRSTSRDEMTTAGLKGNGWQRSREFGESGMYI